MPRTFPLVILVSVCLLTWNHVVLGQISPSGFQDPAGASRAGTGNPPNAPRAPQGGSTLPPGAPARLGK